MAKKGDLATEISAAAAAAQEPAAEQLELMPPTRSTLTGDEEKRVVEAMERFERGRPKGAKNIATRQMLEFVRKMMGDPLERRFRWAMHTPETLSIELGCTKLEAFDRLDRIWSELSRYFYAQQAQVDGAGNVVTPRLTMQFGGHGGPAVGADGGAEPPWLYLRTIDGTAQPSEQNQQLSGAPEGVSHGGVSHGDK